MFAEYDDVMQERVWRILFSADTLHNSFVLTVYNSALADSDHTENGHGQLPRKLPHMGGYNACLMS